MASNSPANVIETPSDKPRNGSVGINASSKDYIRPDQHHEPDAEEIIYSADENTLLIPNKRFHKTKVYKRRWYILIIVSLGLLTQSLTWNAFGPVAPALRIILKWPTSSIALIPGISNVGFVLTGIFFLYMIFWKSLRFCVLAALGANFVSATLECLGMVVHRYTDWSSVWSTLLFYVGSFFNGMCGSVFMSVPPFLSSLWFPLDQRTTATAISSNAGYLGSALAFLIGPGFIGKDVTENDTKRIANLSHEFIEHLDYGFMNNLYFYAALTGAIFVLFIIYFPAKPPLPPTESASLDRLDFAEGFRVLLCSEQFWLQTVTYCMPNGLYNSWLAILSPNYAELGIDEITVGWIGFASMLAGVVGGLLVSWFADHFKKMLRTFLIVMTVGAVICMAAMAVIFEKWITFDVLTTTIVQTTLSVLAGAFINGCTPLVYEMVCETVYPINENLTCWALCTFNCFVGVVLFFLFLIPNMGTSWVIWVMLAALAGSIPLWVLVKPNYTRLLIDLNEPPESKTITT